MTTNPVLALANGFVVLAHARAARTSAPLCAAIIATSAPLAILLPKPIALLYGIDVSIVVTSLLGLAATAALVCLIRSEAKASRHINIARQCALAAASADTAHDLLAIADRIDRELYVPHLRQQVDAEQIIARADTINRALAARDDLPFPMVVTGLSAIALASICITQTADRFTLVMIMSVLLACLCAGRMIYVRRQVKTVRLFLESAIRAIEEAGQTMSIDVLAMIGREIDHWYEVERPINGWSRPARK